MKITLSTQKLRETLAIAARCALGKQTMPILGCVLLEANHAEQRLYLSSTNLDVGIRTSVPAEIDETFAIALNASMLIPIAGNVAGEQITISSKTGQFWVKVDSGRSSFRLNGISGSEFPPVKTDMEGSLLEFTQQTLLQRLSSASAAASRDETRYILNGVFVENRANVQSFVATDGRRMHLFATGVTMEKDSSAILPSAGIQKLCALLKGDKKVSMWVGERKACVRIEREDGDILFTTKLVEGSYPNYRQVIPKRQDTITLDRDVFAAAVSRVAMVTSDKAGSIKIHISGEEMTLSAASPDLGEAKETLTLRNTRGVEGHVAVSPVLLMSAIEAAYTDEIAFSIDSKLPEGSPVLITGGEFTAVVMPVRLS